MNLTDTFKIEPSGDLEIVMSRIFNAPRDIVRPDRIVSTEKFDEAWYPGEALITYRFIEKDGQTTMTCTMRMVSKEARDEVLESGMESGVIVSYDRLDDVLRSMTN